MDKSLVLNLLIGVLDTSANDTVLCKRKAANSYVLKGVMPEFKNSYTASMDNLFKVKYSVCYIDEALAVDKCVVTLNAIALNVIGKEHEKDLKALVRLYLEYRLVYSLLDDKKQRASFSKNSPKYKEAQRIYDKIKGC